MTTQVTGINWERLGNSGKRPIETPVRIVDRNGHLISWAWSPDGEGAYYYSTKPELEANH